MVDKWKHNYVIRELEISGESLSADKSGASQFKNEFSSIAEKNSLVQIFNDDETDLNFKSLPTKSTAFKS